jgi:hypothetical protein
MRRTLRLAAPLALAASLPLAATALAASPPRVVSCAGTENRCVATIPLGGGASDQRITVELPGTSFALTAREVTPASARGAFSLRGGAFRLGGSVWTATLNAVQSLPASARLRLTFTRPVPTRFTWFTLGPVRFHDQGAPGRGVGDTFTFVSRLHTRRNLPPVGTTYGTMTVVDAIDQPGEVVEMRTYHQIFQLAGQDTIVVTGLNTSQPPDTALVPNLPRERAVVGGTGRYSGIRGSVTTTRIGTSDWYRQEFRLRD